jgi:tRNA U34 5-methylaminomethyl-2-thiouridine-forming methyltransferase MnmC
MTTPDQKIHETKILEMTPFGPLVETEDGSLTIRHGTHGQDFHSTEGARGEAWQLYVVASGYLGELSREGCAIHVLDVGMGLGYNAAATIAAWWEGSGTRALRVTSLEIDERLVAAVAGGSAPWFLGWQEPWKQGPDHLVRQSEAEFTARLIHPKSGALCDWRVVVGDGVTSLLTVGQGDFHYIWQDPFTPDLNPLMWSGEWFRSLVPLSSPSVTLMTYSVSRVVRDALQKGGWRPERITTPTRKRHWLRATMVR